MINNHVISPYNIHVIQKTGYENAQTYWVEVVILIEHQTLLTDLQGKVYSMEARINIQILGVEGLTAQCVTKSQLVLAWDLIGEKSGISFSDKSHKELNEFKLTILEFPRHPIWNCCEKLISYQVSKSDIIWLNWWLRDCLLTRTFFFFQSERWKMEKEEKQQKFQMTDSPSNSLCVVISNWYIYHVMMKMIRY